MGLSAADTKQFVEDSQSREDVYIRQIDALYKDAKDEVTNDALSFFNSRRYLNAKSNRKRARAAKDDKGIGAISKKIAKLGKDTINLIHRAQPDFYNSEGKLLTTLWNENTPELFTMTFENATRSKTAFLITEPYVGFLYAASQASATRTAINSWDTSSRGVMSSNVIRVGKVLPSMQMTSDLRKTINTMNDKAVNLMNASLSETLRILINETRAKVLKGEQELSKRLQKRLEKWL
jgi:hypothetical protein